MTPNQLRVVENLDTELTRLSRDTMAGISDLIRVVRREEWSLRLLLRVGNSALYRLPKRAETLNMLAVILGMCEFCLIATYFRVWATLTTRMAHDEAEHTMTALIRTMDYLNKARITGVMDQSEVQYTRFPHLLLLSFIGKNPEDPIESYDHHFVPVFEAVNRGDTPPTNGKFEIIPPEHVRAVLAIFQDTEKELAQ